MCISLHTHIYLMWSCSSLLFILPYPQACHLDSALLVRALDKLSGKLQAMDKLLPPAGLNT